MDSKEAASHALSETSSGSSYLSFNNSENEKLSKNTISVNDYDDVGSVVSDYDDGGYVSGEEEFETASEKSVMVGTVGEGTGEGNSDETFVDAPTDVEYLPVSEVLNDDDVEKVNSNDFVTDNTKEAEFDGVEGLNGEDEIPVEKLVVNGVEIVDNNSGQLMVEEIVKEGAEGADVETEESKLGGDSVVDAINVDVASSGVAVVVEKEENEGRTHTIEGEGFPIESVGDADENSQSSENTGDVKKPEVEIEVNEIEGLNRDENGENQSSDEHTGIYPQQINEVEEEEDKEVDSMSDGDTDGMIFGSSEAARKFIEELEQTSGGDSRTSADSSFEQSRRMDGQIVTDSEEEEEGDTDDEGDDGKEELFDSAALSALLKAATGAESDGGNITIRSRDGTRLFTVERPAGLGSLRPGSQPNRPNPFSRSTLTNVGGAEDNLSEEDKKNLEKLQQIRVKFLRLVHRLGLSPEESVAAQVLYRLALLGGRQNSQMFSLDAAKRMALQLEAEENDNLDFSLNFLVLGKSGVGKSATINSIFGEEKAPIDAFETGTAFAKEISGFVDGVKIRVFDTPGLKSSIMEQSFNNGVLSSVKKLTKTNPPDVVLYVDRLDAKTRDLNDLPLLKTLTSALGPSIWRNAIVTLTHGASAPPDGPNGTPLSYEMFVTQRSHIVQQSIGHAAGDLRMMSPSLMNPVSLVENHPSCRKNREGQKILPNGQSWRPQLLLLCYSMKILSEASAISKPQEPFDHRKLFGFRARAPPLPYMLSSMLQSRAHPKLPSDDNADSDIDMDDLSDLEQEEEDEYDQLPPFKPLKKAQIAKLSQEQKTAYFEEYDYRVKLLQKKQWREELKRMREIKKKGKDFSTDHNLDDDAENGDAAAPVAVPLPDMALPPSFDGDNPAYRYRFLEPNSQFLARPVLDSHGWDHDCGYDGVNLEHGLAIADRFPAAFTVQVTKDKKDFTVTLDSSISAKHGEDMSSMVGFDIQSMGKQLAYTVRGETKTRKFKKHKAAGGIFLTFLGENVVPGLKIEDQVTLGKQYVLVGSGGAVRSQNDNTYGANFELQRREVDYPIGQVQSTLSLSIIKWRGDLALGFNGLAQFAIGRNSKVAVRAGINNKLSGQVSVRTSSSENLSLALAAIIPTAISIYRKLWPGADEKYSIY